MSTIQTNTPGGELEVRDFNGDLTSLRASELISSDITSNNVSLLGSLIENVFTITDGASVNIDPANGTIQVWTLGATRTPTATNFANGQSMTLMVNSGINAVIWTSVPVTWVGGTAPALYTPGYNVIELWDVNNTVYGAFIGLA